MEILLAFIFTIGCIAAESIVFCGATMLTPLMENPDDFITALPEDVLSALKQPLALRKKQAMSKSLMM